MNVYLGPSQSLMKNAYIGEYIPRNGLLGYRPLEENLNDASGNSNNVSWYSGTGSFGTVGGYTGAIVTRNNAQSTQHIITPIQIDDYGKTIAGWIYFSSLGAAWQGFCSDCGQGQGSKQSVTIGLRPADNLNIYANPTGYINGTWQQKGGKVGNKPSTGTWYFWCLASDNEGNSNFYINDTKVSMEFSGGTGTKGNSVFRLGCAQSDNGSTVWNGTDGYIRQFAIWNRKLTDDEVTLYRTQTA